MVTLFAPEPAPAVRHEHRLIDDLGFNSLRLMELAFALEELFRMDLESSGFVPAADTVGELCDFISARAAAGEATIPKPEAMDAVVAEL
ncbi:acyl carrier protein [Micromonospora sp. RP3T]|uniref:acyl carrier protein n=1 Tax=Micromonospora sp. RP3T TaxID=2135446 RepID=UPI003D725D0A